jgi:hypothetical protein
MAAFTKKVRLAVNPTTAHRKKGSRPPAAKKGRHSMAKPGTKKNKAGRKPKKNPAATNRRKKRNPTHGLAGTIGSPKDFIMGSVAGLAAAVATRQLPQLILSDSNTGMEGYLANIGTGIIATIAAGMIGGPAAGRGAAIGASVIVLDRILSDNVSPISSYLSLSGVGDHNAYGKMGTIRTGFFGHPNLTNSDGSMYIPDPFNDAAVQAVLAKYPQLAAPIAAAATGRMGAVHPSALRKHVANGMTLSSRYQTRFNQ